MAFSPTRIEIGICGHHVVAASADAARFGVSSCPEPSGWLSYDEASGPTNPQT